LAQKITVLDLYSGLGGLSLGFEFTGAFKTIGGIDNYDWAVKTFYHNHNDLNLRLVSQPQNLSQLEPKAVLDDLGEKPDVIIGGPPCQGFSHAGKRLESVQDDTRNEQVRHFLKFVKIIRPKVFLMENVSGILVTGQQKKNDLLNFLIDKYQALGYKTSWKVLNSADYRVPQRRKRLFLIGLLDNEKAFTFPEPSCGETFDLFSNAEPFYTVGDALNDLPTPEEDEPQNYEEKPKTNLQKFLRVNSTALHNHLVTKHGKEMLIKLKKQKTGTRLYPNWNHSWYRLDPSKPSPAVKENHRAPFVHFAEPRATSPRECARLQTIPDHYILLGTKTAQLIMVGNAVPPILSAHIATGIAQQYFKIEIPYPWTSSHNPLLLNGESSNAPSTN